MLPYLSWYGLNTRVPFMMGLTDVGIRPAQPAILDTVQEIAIYIHRFHNLDLFEQG